MQTMWAIAEAARRLIDQPAFFLGIIALIGLLLQRKSAAETIQGTLHTVLGLIVFQAGAAELVSGIGPVTQMMQTGWGVTGIYPLNELAFMNVMDLMAHTIVPTLLLGWLVHILMVRVLPWFRCVFLTAHMMLYTATLLNLGLAGGLGLSGSPLIVVSAFCCALFWTVMPQWTLKYSREFAGDEFTLGHHVHLGCILAAEIGKRFGKAEEEDADRLQLPAGLELFKDATLNAAITVPIFFFIIGLLVGIPAVQELSGESPWWMYLIMQGLQFAAGLTVLLLGVHQFLDAITAAFKGFSQTLLPGAIPALDIPVFFPYSPMGTLLGFLGGALGMILVSAILIAIKSPLFVFPSLILAFFEPGIEGVFANRFGGWKAALLAGFLGGVIFSLGILWLQPLTPQLAGTGTQFGNIDTVLVIAPFSWLARAIGSLLGLAQLLG